MALEVEHLSGQYSLLNDVSFNVERVRSLDWPVWMEADGPEVLENLSGIATRKSGMIRLDGKQVLKPQCKRVD